MTGIRQTDASKTYLSAKKKQITTHFTQLASQAGTNKRKTE